MAVITACSAVGIRMVHMKKLCKHISPTVDSEFSIVYIYIYIYIYINQNTDTGNNFVE